MKSLPRPLIIAIIAILVLTAGSLLLIRSCLFGKGGKGLGGAPAGMREQYASAPALYLEKDGKAVILTIMPHLKIHSYSRQGNMVRKSASTTYYLQTNDANTAAMLSETKLKSHTDIKNYPVEVMGASGSIAWVFMGEPMAFDAFTMEKKADIQLLEEKNKDLAGKFPAERRYYRFDKKAGTIFFTAIDGTKWKLDTKTLQASPSAEEEDGDDTGQDRKAVEKAEKQNQAELDSLYQHMDRAPSKQYAAGEISYAEYNRISKQYRELRDQLFKKRDSLRERRHKLQDIDRGEQQIERYLENLQKGKPNYSEISVNQDTIGGKWYGIYAVAEMKKLNERLQYHHEQDETARRQLYISTWKENRTGNLEFDKEAATSPAGQTGFLHGGFLLDKNNARPIHLPGNAFIVIHKEQIGREANILLSKVTDAGQVVWTSNTRLAEWADWFYTGRQLIIMGTDNKDLSSGQVNVLLCIDIATGKSSRYDYYLDKIVAEK